MFSHRIKFNGKEVNFTEQKGSKWSSCDVFSINDLISPQESAMISGTYDSGDMSSTVSTYTINKMFTFEGIFVEAETPMQFTSCSLFN
jgi:hypothetical protein